MVHVLRKKGGRLRPEGHVLSRVPGWVQSHLDYVIMDYVNHKVTLCLLTRRIEQIGVVVCPSHCEDKPCEPVYCVTDAAQHNLVIEDDLFRQRPAP